MLLEEFLSRLDRPKKCGSGYMACCPAHADRSPSLSVKRIGNKILLNCFAGCSSKEVLAAIGLQMRDLFEDSGNYHDNSPNPRRGPMTADEIEDRLTFAENMPRPLPKALKPVPRLATVMIPEPLSPWIVDIAERMQCPIEFPAVAALVAAGSLIGNAVGVKPKRHDPWVEFANIWGAIVGDPGVMKTPAVEEALRFIREIERREAAAFEAEKAAHEFARQSREAEMKVIQKELEKSYRPTAGSATTDKAIELLVDRESLRERFRRLEAQEMPKPKRLITADATVEKLGELLNENPRGLLNVRDELSGFIDTMEKPGREGDRGFYLETWTGKGSLNVDRIGRGSFRINNLTLSIFGTIQPSIIAPLFKTTGSKKAGDGLVQRFQATVYPDVPNEFEYVDRPPVGVDAARAVYEGLYTIDTAQFEKLPDDIGGYRWIGFSPEAQRFFQNWLVVVEKKLRNGSIGSSMLQGHIAKYRGFMPVLALIFHLIDSAAAKEVGTSISLENAQLATKWCDFFQVHAERLYDLSTHIGIPTARRILKKIKSGDLGHKFSARDVYRPKWSGLTEQKEVKEGLEILVDYGYLHEVSIRPTDRSKTVYVPHPSLTSGTD